MFEVKGFALALLKFLSQFDSSVKEVELFNNFLTFYRESQIKTYEKSKGIKFLVDSGYIETDLNFSVFIKQKGKDYITQFDKFEHSQVFAEEYDYVILKFLYFMGEPVDPACFPELLKSHIKPQAQSMSKELVLSHYIQFDSKLHPYVDYINQQFVLSKVGRLYVEEKLINVNEITAPMDRNFIKQEILNLVDQAAGNDVNIAGIIKKYCEGHSHDEQIDIRRLIRSVCIDLENNNEIIISGSSNIVSTLASVFNNNGIIIRSTHGRQEKLKDKQERMNDQQKNISIETMHGPIIQDSILSHSPVGQNVTNVSSTKNDAKNNKNREILMVFLLSIIAGIIILAVEYNWFARPDTPDNSPARTVNKEDIQRIKNQIPVNLPVIISYSVREPESAAYGEALSNKMVALGYKVERSIAMGQLVTGSQNPRFSLEVDSAKADITVASLK